jgi:putative membrane protein
LSAGATLVLPSFARLFLRDARAAVEVQQYAQAQFVEREMFATADRTAIVLVTCLLERRVVLLADVGLRDRVRHGAWDAVIARMTPLLRARQTGAAVLAGLDHIGEILKAAGFGPGPRPNTFADPPIEVRAP